MEIYVVSYPDYADEYYLTPESAVKRLICFFDWDGFPTDGDIKETLLSALKKRNATRLGNATILKKRVYN